MGRTFGFRFDMKGSGIEWVRCWGGGGGFKGLIGVWQTLMRFMYTIRVCIGIPFVGYVM